jgi:hypothetical protein
MRVRHGLAKTPSRIYCADTDRGVLAPEGHDSISARGPELPVAHGIEVVTRGRWAQQRAPRRTQRTHVSILTSLAEQLRWCRFVFVSRAVEFY